MKKLFFILASAALVACGGNSAKQAEVTDPAQNENLPAVLREHPLLSEFTCLQQEEPVQMQLFANPTDTTAFHFFDEKNGRTTSTDMFRIEDGVVRMDGENGGYIMADQEFSNFYLRVQIKWGDKSYGTWAEKPKNGGIQFGLKPTEDKLWPDNYEYEIMEEAIGELWTGRPFETPNDTVHLGPTYCRVFCSDKTLEKPANEWNTLELICFDNKVEHYLNGTKVLEATVPEGMNQGKLLLQYEYTDIYYKDCVLIPLK